MTAEARAFVATFYSRLYSPECLQAIADSVAVDYVEHQYTAGFSREGLGAYVKSRLARHPSHRVIVHKTLSDGDFVFVLAEEKLGNGIDVARGELFRIDDGKIAEHWGAHVADEKNRKNPNGTFDGPQPDRSVDYGRRSLPRLEELDLRGFDRQEIECFYESRTSEYRQHSPKGGDGLEGLVSILRHLKACGQRMMMQPKRSLADGDFIVCHRLYDSFPKHPLISRINTFDLFRMNAEGRAAEHWDVMEEIPSEDMLAALF